MRTGCIVRAPKKNIFGHNAVIGPPAQPAELQVESARMQFVEQRIFDEIREADVIEIKHCSGQREHDQESRDSTSPKNHPATMPSARLSFCRHVRAPLGLPG